jgi:hypothetical protein
MNTKVMVPGIVIIRLTMIFLIFLFSSGCKTYPPQSAESAQGKNYFLSAPPSGDVSEALERIARCVKKVYSVASYTTWQFKPDQAVTGFHVQTGRFKMMALGVVSTNETVSGTATVLEYNAKRITLVTCAHIVAAPDTLTSFFEPAGNDANRYIKSISILEKQENWIRDFSVCGPFTVTRIVKETDIAFISSFCDLPPDSVPILPCRKGDANLLKLGNFAYILGYPHGNLMITSALISPMPKRPNGEFTIDALLNKGFSGGIVLAVNQSGQFVLAGMVERVQSEHQTWLRPPGDNLRVPEWIPYSGPMFITSSEQIHYGLNTIIPVNLIVSQKK